MRRNSGRNCFVLSWRQSRCQPQHFHQCSVFIKVSIKLFAAVRWNYPSHEVQEMCARSSHSLGQWRHCLFCYGARYSRQGRSIVVSRYRRPELWLRGPFPLALCLSGREELWLGHQNPRGMEVPPREKASLALGPRVRICSFLTKFDFEELAHG